MKPTAVAAYTADRVLTATVAHTRRTGNTATGTGVAVCIADPLPMAADARITLTGPTRTEAALDTETEFRTSYET